ncbi:MAG: hypothetical protein JXA90_13395 [Planctomycetes bacterium]|nr:hypothetical protein [Planctomycetota bacterium]
MALWILLSMLAGADDAAGDAAGSADRHDYFTNSWSAVGLKDYALATRITPDHRLLLSEGRSLRIRCGSGAKPLPRREPKTLLAGWLPVVVIEARDGPVRYEALIWASPSPRVEDWRAAYDGPEAGEEYINWTAVRARNDGAAPAEAVVVFDLAAKDGAAETIHRAAWLLDPGGSRSAAVAVPREGEIGAASRSEEEARLWLERTTGYWKDLLARGALIEIPDARAMNAHRASLVHQIIGLDGGELHAGEGFYDRFYIRDAAYQVLQLEEAGLCDIARRAMEPFLRCQLPDGRFESQKGQLDANGQAIWALWHHYVMTRDSEWLERVYPSLRRAADWIRKARAATRDDPRFPGLLPAALADGEYLWAGKNHIVGYDFWNLRGLLCASRAAEALGEQADRRLFDAEAREYRSSIDAAWRRTGLPHFPPSWEGEGTPWGNTETLWPLPLFDEDDPRVSATLEEVRQRHGGGFLEGTIRWCPGRVAAIHPYLSSYTTLASLSRGEHETVAEEFYWYLFHSTAAHSFPEGIYHRRRFAWGDTIPHLLGAANYSILLRRMLVHEQGDELDLLSGIPDAWLDPGCEIRLERLPTSFGELDLRAVSTAEGITVRLRAPRRDPPARIRLHAPGSRPVLEPPAGVEIVRREPQSRRWSLEEVIRIYREQPPARPIEGLVRWPLDATLDGSRARTIDLRRAANADPFSAPFGVENPGRFLFTGLEPGRRSIEGVPFEIVDPAGNEGRGFIVLEGRSGSARFPREAMIPVGAAGRRLFLLGNVHGWLPDDEGAVESGALAEYVLRYADGAEQRIPLIAGRTTDDWASEPLASEAAVALRGDPWHLNVLVVELRPEELSEILFRDLGTPSAPLLAAVTLELLP